MQSNRIWLDSALGQPLHPAASEAGNLARQSSFSGVAGYYSEAKRTSNLRHTALKSIATSLGVTPAQILPLPNLAAALKFVAESAPTAGSFSATSRSTIKQLLQQKQVENEVPVTQTGLEATEISPIWHLTQAGNPETGVIADLSGLGNLTEQLVVDATEWVGRMPGLPAGDLLIIRGHSFAGGSICFLIKTDSEWQLTDLQRQALAPEIPDSVAAAIALENLNPVVSENHREWIAEFEVAISEISEVHIIESFSIFDSRRRLPHLTTFIVENLEAEFLASELDRHGFAVGAGAACGLQSQTSSVLNAMGHFNVANIRIGLPLSARQSDLEKLADKLPAALKAILGD